MAALMGGCSLQGMAQQITPKDVAGDKEYNRVCREYELKGGDSMELLQAYLDKYPDSRHKNRVLSLIASAYFMEGKYKEAIALFRSCDLEAFHSHIFCSCFFQALLIGFLICFFRFQLHFKSSFGKCLFSEFRFSGFKLYRLQILASIKSFLSNPLHICTKYNGFQFFVRFKCF